MTQVSILPIITSSTTSLEITPSQVAPTTATTTVPTTVQKTKTINRSQIKTSTVFKDAPTSSLPENDTTFSLAPINVQKTFEWLPTANRVIIGLCLGGVFFCFLGIITYKIRKRLQGKRKEEEDKSASFSPTTPQTPNTPSSSGLKERKKHNAWF